MTPRDPYVAQRCAEIDLSLIDAVTWSATDAKLGAYLAGYVTILISGVVEDCIEYLVKQRAVRSQDPELTEFVSRLVGGSFSNPRSESISSLLGRFSSAYEQQYQDSVALSSREALGSIMANRLSLAHVGTWKQQTTVADVQSYFSRIVPILSVVEDILLPP